MGPYRERHSSPELSSTHSLVINLSLEVPGKWTPLHVPQQGPYGERCFISRANGLFIHLYLSESPIKDPSHEKRGKHTVTIHGAPRGQKGYIWWGTVWFPKGIVYCSHYPSAIKPSARYLTPWLGKTVAPLANVCHSSPHQGTPPHLLLPPMWPRVK